MSLDQIIPFIDNPFLATARVVVSGAGFTLSLFPIAAVASFLGVIAAAPFISKYNPKMEKNQIFCFKGQPLNSFVNSAIASFSRRSDEDYESILKDLQVIFIQYFIWFNENVY